MFEVMKQRCNECLYGNNYIVSDERRAEIMADLKASDNYFICHKATIAQRTICCRGDWEVRGGGQVGQIAERLRVVVFVDEPGTKPERPRGYTTVMECGFIVVVLIGSVILGLILPYL